MSGLAEDGGLFVPEEIPSYRPAALSSLGKMNFHDIAYETILPYVKGEIPEAALRDIITSAYTFDAPVVTVGGRYVLELFHGPTAAFKDFGARFMARTFAYLRRGETRPLKILVATSGDTGGAVADGFFGVEGISVTVLYPQGRVSPLQERQIAGLGGNTRAVAVKGSFDDCQRLVKEAFAALKKRVDISSANSINIARLIPQAIYYTSSSASVRKSAEDLPVFSVPSGNFGNLTAGLYAQKMGAPIKRFIAATNINKTFPEYLESGVYKARESQATLSNAMDVGSPSNFERMNSHWTHKEMRELMLSTFVTDDDTKKTISGVHKTCGYFLDPHGAVGWKAADYFEKSEALGDVVILETAHPAKFSETVEPITGAVPMPESLAGVMRRAVHSDVIPVDIDALISLL
ncbi:threonine synthase [Spirochaetia bacterium]|nr:threonine synthase [Spirochaetia bacterium]